jgi:hypothetical protein
MKGWRVRIFGNVERRNEVLEIEKVKDPFQ